MDNPCWLGRSRLRLRGCFHKVIVSTDDDEIAMVARNNGAETPFVRPAELSDHLTGTNAVMLHALHWLLNAGYSPKAVCCIYATAPFIQAGDLLNGLKLLNSQRLDYVFSATSYGFPIQRAFRVNPSGRVEMCQPEHLYTRSQDLEETFHDAGQFYWGRKNAWLTNNRILSKGVGYEIPSWRVVDIDTPADWVRAERMAASLKAH